MAKDFLLNEDNDLIIKHGDFAIGESEMQEVGIILAMNQGQLKSDPIIGANLTNKIRTPENRDQIERTVSTQLELDGKDYDDIKKRILLKLK